MAKNVHEAREIQSMAYEDQLSYEKQMQWRFLMQPIYQAYWLKKRKTTETWERRACRKEFKKKRLALSNRYWGPPAECAPTEIDSDSSVATTVLIDVDTLA